MGKSSYYHSEGSFTKKRSKRWILVFILLISLLAGAYVFFLIQSPNFTVGATPSNIVEDKLRDEEANYLKIAKLDVVIPLAGSNDLTSLKAGGGYQTSDSGDPKQGGNFAIGALRFQLGLTPAEIKAKSPFYNLNKLAEGDVVTVFYDGTEYSYKVGKVSSAEPRDESVTEQSKDHKLTLYTATGTGIVDGNTVVEANPLFDTAGSEPEDDSTPLL